MTELALKAGFGSERYFVTEAFSFEFWLNNFSLLMIFLQRTSPMTNLRLENLTLVPNINLKQAIVAYMEVGLSK